MAKNDKQTIDVASFRGESVSLSDRPELPGGQASVLGESGPLIGLGESLPPQVFGKSVSPNGSMLKNSVMEEIARENIAEMKTAVHRVIGRVERLQASIAELLMCGEDVTNEKIALEQLTDAMRMAIEAHRAAEDICAMADFEPDSESDVILIQTFEEPSLLDKGRGGGDASVSIVDTSTKVQS